MLINISLLKYVTLVLLISSCNSSKNVSGVNSGTENSYKVATLIKTACYGSCPIYEMTIYSNLVVEFSGERFVNNIGKFTSRIAQSDLQNLQDAFSENEFFELEDEIQAKKRVAECLTEWGKVGHRPKGWRNPGWLAHPYAIDVLRDFFEYF